MSVYESNLSAARWIARIGALTVASIGAIVLVGWIFDSTLLQIIGPGLTSMKANAAIAFVAAGSSLGVLVSAPATSKAVAAARALAVVVVIIGGVTLAEYVFSSNLGVDQLFFHDRSIRYPGRMAPATAVTFFFVGLALLALLRRSSRALVFAGWVSGLTLFSATLSLTGYAYVRSVYQVSSYASVALHTTVCFWLISLAMLAAAPTHGFVAIVVSDTSGGLAARQLLPTIPLILFAVGWIGLAGAEAGLYQEMFAFSLVVILSMSVSLMAIVFTARKLHRLDLVRQQAAADIVALNIGLQQKNAELEAANGMKSEFLGTMSHELRTPLNAIIGFSELLKDGLMGELTDPQRGFVSDIFRSGKHLLSLINDILDLTKVEAGKMLLDLEPVAISELLMSTMSIVREKAATRQLRVEVDVPEELGWIQVDPRKVKQILYNLLSNAVKFSTKGGQLTLRASRVSRADVGRVSDSDSRTGRSFPLTDTAFTEFIRITVTDSGIGISPEGMEVLFKPFSQVDSGLSRRFEGTGLGLVMVKRLAELHGGTVAVESTVDEGSCFSVWLPLRTLEHRALAPATGLAGQRIDGPEGIRTALVVEDDYDSAELIRMQLVPEGFVVLHAASAEMAVVLAVQQSLSLIILDMALPNMNGWDLLNRLKQAPDLRRVPVVIISMAADANKGFSLGAAAVLQKPISRQELYETLIGLRLLPVQERPGLKVLVVDDDPKAVELIAVRLSGLVGTVLRAYDGREAIDLARRELPDVIVLDLMMPEVNGFDVVVALSERPETSRIPILVVTAKEVTDEDRANLTGLATASTGKAAFDPERFRAEVRRAMSERQLVA